MKTQVLGVDSPSARKIAVAAAIEHLRRGDVVALPTETVYGLAADALNVRAVLKIFEAKERPRFDPLIVHLPGVEWLDRLTSTPPADKDLIDRLTNAFWPGPLTLVLPRRGIVPDIVTAGLETVAIRLSAHPVFREVIEALKKPLAAPSANRFGRISPTQADHVLAELGGRIPLILDGGSASHGLESTIVAARNGGIEILREGPVTLEALQELADVRVGNRPGRIEAPGQLPTHYAPRTPLVLTKDFATFRAEGRKVGVLSLRSLSGEGDLREAAANLFRRLRDLDDSGYDLLVAEEVPEVGLGRAIMDRLRRAAAGNRRANFDALGRLE